MDHWYVVFVRSATSVGHAGFSCEIFSHADHVSYCCSAAYLIGPHLYEVIQSFD